MGINFKRPTLLNSVDDWVVGSGSQGVYTQNGSVNTRITGTDPFGGTSVLWQGVSPGDNSADGGFGVSGIAIDPTKLYRFSVWVKRTSSSGTFTFYFGTGSDVNLLNLDGGVGAGNNPYWECSAGTSLTQNVWYLFVGHIFPSDFPNNASGIGHPNTGRWTIAGKRVGGVNACNITFQDLKFAPTSTTASIRSYQYSSTSNTDTMLWYGARVELCDGSEGTVESLLGNEQSTKLASITITEEGSSKLHQKVVASGGNEVKVVGEWRIHTFSGSSSFIVSSYVGSALRVEYLIVGGGGGTGYDVGGGGGGGGVLTGYCYLSGTTYTITIGGGGASAASAGRGTTGSDSVFNGLTAKGGGGGGFFAGPTAGLDGGSGGGGASINGTAGNTLDTVQGFPGGTGASGYYGGAGGGGAGGAGANGVTNTQVAGGVPRVCGINGRPLKYSGGGYGNSDVGYIAPTGTSAGGLYIGTYGFGANGTGAPNASPYNGNGGVVIIRYKYR